jgi:hypothetical protein
MANISYLARPVTRLATIAVILATLTGCQAIVSSAPVAQVRVIAASPDAPSLDVYKGSNALAHNLGFGTVTSYIPLTTGPDTVAANTAGTKQLLTLSKANFAASGQYTILLGNTAAGLQQITLTDQSQPAPSGQVSLRFLDQATRAGAVDVYLVPSGQRLTSVTPLVSSITFGANTGYLNIPAATYSLVMMRSGIASAASPTTYTGPEVTYTPGTARTLILIDQPLVTSAGLQVITANDFDPATD